MDFIFFCPSVGKTFESNNFKITENKGVKTNPDGQRFLDAKVELTAPCPLCNAFHTYQASELTCPFNPEG